MKIFFFLLFFLVLHPLLADEASLQEVAPAPRIDASLCGSVVVPNIEASSYATGGCGAAVYCALKNLALPHSLILVSAGYEFLFEDKSYIDTYQLLSVSLCLGYSFPLSGEGITLTPLLGAGYLLHIMNSDLNNMNGSGSFHYTYKTYADPLLLAGCELNVLLMENLYLVLLPEYTIFFEEDYVGSFIKCKAGVKYSFSLGGVQAPVTTRAVQALPVDRPRFSPNSDGVSDVIVFSPPAASRSKTNQYELRITDNKNKVIKEIKVQNAVPAALTWDGKNKQGATAADGAYRAELTLYYTDNEPLVLRSAEFYLDTKAPEVELKLSPDPFSPDNDGVNDILTIKLAVEDESPIADWNIQIYDPQNNPFKSFKGKGAPPQTLTWNGYAEKGEFVQSAEEYSVVATVNDALGNQRVIKRQVSIDVLVYRESGRLRIIVRSITFAPNTSDYVNVSPKELEKNIKTLKRLAEILNRYRDYTITIEGHAVNIYWYDAKLAEKEHRDVLLPLSQMRADAIKKALVGMGVKAERITTVGKGSSEPIVPFSDEKNRWKNRRVEFILKNK
jgi:outer membrane protein OmpA-like peptidoglycan-associated protein